MSSLALLVASQPRPVGMYLATLDAMRGEHFCAAFRVESDRRIQPLGPARRLTPEMVVQDASRDAMVVLGDAATAVPRSYPEAAGAAILRRSGLVTLVDLDSWEPDYGRLAEAQVQWEATHGRPLQGAP
jgi:tRNA threonylcarbamoyladenosine biosynthesis protein TsaB